VNSKRTQTEHHNVKKNIWVKARQIKAVTGWSDKVMMEAREKNWLTWRFTPESKFEYDLNSLNQLFIKKAADLERRTA
jgi:hypothetical protein